MLLSFWVYCSERSVGRQIKYEMLLTAFVLTFFKTEAENLLKSKPRKVLDLKKYGLDFCRGAGIKSRCHTVIPAQITALR